MERVYALGVSVTEFLQYWCKDYEGYFEVVNSLSNPHHVLELLFPLVAILDSVFAAQLVLCVAFGSWLNSVMKWWLLEERPYWWVEETDFYSNEDRPKLRQTPQSCETGPGSPSGHTQTISMVCVLAICWALHVMHAKKCYVWWWKVIAYPLSAVSVGSVMLARLYVAAHFLHQVLLGAFIGAFLAPGLCIYVCDPFLWRIGCQAAASVHRTMLMHVLSAMITVVISLVTYVGLLVCGWDPLWTVDLAFRWCRYPEHIHITTNPMFALVHSTGHLLGWAICVSPTVAKYRHYTPDRSLVIATLASAILLYSYKQLQTHISKDNASIFYSLHFILCTVKPALFLRVVPMLATFPYAGKQKVK